MTPQRLFQQCTSKFSNNYEAKTNFSDKTKMKPKQTLSSVPCWYCGGQFCTINFHYTFPKMEAFRVHKNNHSFGAKQPHCD